MYLKLRTFLQAFILANQVFIRYKMLDFSLPLGVRNRFAILKKTCYCHIITLLYFMTGSPYFKKSLFLIIKFIMYKKNWLNHLLFNIKPWSKFWNANVFTANKNS